MELRNQFIYNPTLNHTANWPILSTFIGLARIIVHLAYLARNLFLLISDNKPYHLMQISLDLRGIVRGLIELPPILGGIGSWYIDHFQLTPAQELAYRVQEIYDRNLKDVDKWVEDEKDLVEVDPTKPPYNDPEFLDFINKEKVKISTDQAKIDTFCEYYKKCEAHEIFEDRKLPFYALAAFAQKRMDREDVATLLNMYYAKHCFKDLQVFTIYDQKGNLTQEGSRLVDTLFKQDSTWLGKGTAPDKSKLLEELKKLPLYKQIFWKHEGLLTAQKVKSMDPLSMVELYYSPIGSLYASLVSIGGIWFDGGQELGLPLSVERLFFNRKYNKQNDPFKPRLGKFSVQDITKDVEEHSQRLCATFFPGTKQKTEVHNSLELPTSVVAHDKSHAHILQQYPQEFLNFIAELRKDFRTQTGFEISKETWELVELVAPTILDKNLSSKLFAFTDNEGGRLDELSIKELFWNLENPLKPEPTPLFWLMLLKLKANPKWPFNPTAWVRENICVELRATDKMWEGYSLKQKIWKLMNQHSKHKNIEVLPDANLKFVKVKSGRRKNTVELVEVKSQQA